MNLHSCVNGLYTPIRPNFFMAKRLTIVLDDEIVKKLRVIQAKKISKSANSVSFSNVINTELKRILK